jgi:hypothetical protein
VYIDTNFFSMFWCRELAPEICPRILDTPCIGVTQWILPLYFIVKQSGRVKRVEILDNELQVSKCRINTFPCLNFQILYIVCCARKHGSGGSYFTCSVLSVTYECGEC